MSEGFSWKVIASVHLPNSAFTKDSFRTITRFPSHNVLRGLHYQINQPQGKLVRAITGEILDVALDLRKSSATFGKWGNIPPIRRQQTHAVGASGICPRIPRCLRKPPRHLQGHRFLCHHQHERTVNWNDPYLAIDWQLDGKPAISGKDQRGTSFRDCKKFQ